MTDSRNVPDHFKGWQTALLKEEFNANTLPYAALMENWSSDFNISTLIRNANFFSCKEVFYLQKKKHIDSRGAVGAQHYSLIKHLKEIGQIDALKEHYHLVAIDINLESNLKQSSIYDFKWPVNTLMVFGSESQGISPELLAKCEEMVSIPRLGIVRSLNCGCASAICFSDYVRKYVSD